MIADKLIPGERADEPTEGTVWSPPAEVIPLRRPEPGSLGGLLTSVSELAARGRDQGRHRRPVPPHQPDRRSRSRFRGPRRPSAVVHRGLRPCPLPQVLAPAAGASGRIDRRHPGSGSRPRQRPIPGGHRHLPPVRPLPGTADGQGCPIRAHRVTTSQLDRQIVDLLREPLRHLLVNAVDHGIEPTAVRVAAGKKPTGVVSVAARDRRRESRGLGIRRRRRDRLGSRGGCGHRTQHPFDFSDLTPLLFQPGFTTTDERDRLLGRRRRPGRVRRDSLSGSTASSTSNRPEGTGTTVTMTLPLSMVLQNVVVVAAGDQFWGLPEASVEAAMPLSRAEISADRQRCARSDSRVAQVPCVSLAQGDGRLGAGR